jgi:type II secretory pathway pseudopilin PulG
MDQPPARRATLRLGARELHRMQTSVIVLILVLLALALRPWFLNTIQTRDFQVCQSNMRSISQALQNYAIDWDGAYPPAENWMDDAKAFLRGASGDPRAIDAAFHCPRDKTGSASSYAYNTLFSGLSPTLRSEDPKLLAQAARLGRLERAVLVIEKHGARPNGHVELPDWNAVARELTRPHQLKSPTGSLIRGSGGVGSKSDLDLQELVDKRF